jgi:signal transduction histidine kinase
LHALDGNLEKLRKAESRLKTYSEQLELIVESRTNELSRKNIQLIKGNHDLRVAKEEALQKAKARADFLANMSHEIRTPFNGVLGMIGLTLEEPLSEKQKEQLNVAYSSGVALLELLNDILDISKVEAGKLTLENISFNLRKVVEDVTRLLAQNAHAKSVELHSLVAADFPERVYGDPTRIRQIISNLVGNAIKFTEQGAVSIHLSAPANQGIELAVTDTGIGIDDSQIDAVFSPFSQGDKQTTRKFGGTGLGLTLCKQLVNHMDGQLTVESSPGKGSSFKVVLPLLTDRQVKPPIIDPRLHDCHYVLIHRQTNETFTSIGAEFKQWKLHYQALSYQQIQDLDLKHYPFQTDTMVLFDSRSLAPALVELACINQLTLILVARLSIFCEKSVLQSMKIKELVSAPLSRSRLRDTLYKAIGIYGKAAPSQDQLPELTAKSGKHILLVEDNKVNQLVAKTILAKLGYRVTIANDGKEAIERISHEDFSIVLMDCHMPVLDGYEATREIRKQERFQHLPIIAVTANVMEGDREKCMACGMNDYLSKPYDKKVLTDKLAKWLA